MPLAHWFCGRLCRTSAVLEATIDRNTPPNTMPDNIKTVKLLDTAGTSVAIPNKPLSKAMARPPFSRSSKRAQTREDAITARPSTA